MPLKGSLEEFWASSRSFETPVQPETPQCGFVVRIMTLRRLAYIAQFTKADCMAAGITEPPPEKCHEQDKKTIWRDIAAPDGARQVSQKLADLKCKITNRSQCLWFTNPDQVESDFSHDAADLKRVLHMSGKTADDVHPDPRVEPIPYVSVKIGMKYVPQLCLPAIWHGTVLYFRPTTDPVLHWGRAVNFEDKNYEEGYPEAVHKPVYWHESFEISRFGILSQHLVEMTERDWLEYLPKSLLFEAYKDYD
jgi:hypothetical protein